MGDKQKKVRLTNAGSCNHSFILNGKEFGVPQGCFHGDLDPVRRLKNKRWILANKYGYIILADEKELVFVRGSNVGPQQ